MNKQIEERLLKAEIYDTLMLEAECPLSGMDCEIIADLMINKGYRKQSEVAREIIDLIDEWFMYCEQYSGHIIKSELAELRKKYGVQEDASDD